MARAPARLLCRVRLRFVTEEQLLAAGPLSPPIPEALRLEVQPAGDAADATVTDGEVLGSCGPWARGWGARRCGRGRLCTPTAR